MSMTNIFEEDADALQVSNEHLKEIAKLAGRAKELEKDVEDLESVLKERKGQLRKLVEETIPEALATVGMTSFKMEDGSSITVKPFYSASIPGERQHEAFAWLREHGFDDIIKNTVSVRFGRGEDDRCNEVLNMITSAGYAPEQAEKIEPMTLKAWVKEQVEKGSEFPSELFGLYIGQKAVIKSK